MIESTTTTAAVARRLLGPLAVLALLAAACGSDGDALDVDTSDVSSEISDVLDGDTGVDEQASQAGRELEAQLGQADLSTLYSAMDLIGFDRLDPEETFTFFAPNDSAFAAVDADRLASLVAGPTQLGAILEDHLISETVMAGELTDGTITSEGGLELLIDLTGPVPTVNGIEIVETDLTVGNGVVHVIDGVLLGDSE